MRFLWTVARILAKNAANSLGFGLGDSAVEIWEAWSKETPSAEQRLAEVQEVAQLSQVKASDLAKRIVLELATDQPDTRCDQVAAVLTQIPENTRRSLRRPADPSGKSLRPSMAVDGPESVRALLPTKLPRFKAGDCPLAGVDLELVELLGVGGFGEVWKARNPFLDGVPQVALKFCTDIEAARTLRHEAGVLNQVMRQGTHPGIVRLLHSYLRADPPCLEYEYVAGGDIAGVIRDWHCSGTCPIELFTSVITELADIVGFAHRLTPPVVHRDLKPANILVQSGPGDTLQLTVTDFGIGGIAANQTIKELAAKPAWHVTAMATGTYTPLYASPQQTAGKPADPRDDVHALGVLWYQMLTGNLSAGRPGGSWWKKKLAGQGMKAELIELLEGCFEEEPENRPRDAAELASRIRDCTALPGGSEAILLPPGPIATPPSTQERINPTQAPESASVEKDEWVEEKPVAAAAARLWKQYTRQNIPPLFGMEFSEAIWNVGYVRREKLLILLVTLEKAGVEEKFQYVDHFLAPDLFQWESQNRTRKESTDGQALSRHAELGYQVHLFIRRTKKLKGKPVPFHYCGEVRFVEWENETPITIRWRLANPVPKHLWPMFQVPG